MCRAPLVCLVLLPLLWVSGCDRKDTRAPAKQAPSAARDASGGSPTAPSRDPEPKAAPTDDDDTWAFIDDPAELGVDPGLTAKARVLWDTRCAHCHGIHGGDGPSKKGFDPKPANFQSDQWQEANTDDHIRKVVLEGGERYGLSPAMGANLDLRDKPELMDEIVRLLRGFPYWSGRAPVPAPHDAPAKGATGQ